MPAANLIFLDPADRGKLTTVDAGSTNNVVFGTDGNVTQTDVTDDFFVTSDSDLEQLIVDAAALLGIRESDFSNMLFDMGLLTPVSPTGGRFPGKTGFFLTATGQVEVDNGTMEIGEVIDTGDGNDVVHAGGGNDIVFAGAGDDVLRGGDGTDLLFGQAGDDALKGGKDDDLLVGGAGADDLNGGKGNDTASYFDSGAAVDVDLSDDGPQSGGDAEGDTLAGIENLVGSAYDDTLTGDDGDNSIDGGAGRDTIDGGDGVDTIDGGIGRDTIFGGNGGDNDIIDLGRDVTSPDSVFDRDNSSDFVKAAATFADNGTDTVLNYSDGQFGQIFIDVIDLSDSFDFTLDADTAVEREAELTAAFDATVVGNSAEIQDGDGNTWFILHEDEDGSDSGAAPEAVYAVVDGFVFKWDIAGGASDWDQIGVL